MQSTQGRVQILVKIATFGHVIPIHAIAGADGKAFIVLLPLPAAKAKRQKWEVISPIIVL